MFSTADILPYIKRGGILPFHFIKNTDHRGLFADIDLQGYLRRKPPQINHSSARKLQSNRPKAVKEYGQRLHHWIHQENITQRLKDIQTNIQHTQMRQQSIAQLQILEQQFTKARLDAEKSLPKGPQHPWSPQLRQAQQSVLYYKLWVSQYTHHKDFHFHRQKYGLQNLQDPQNKTQAQHLLRQAQSHLKEVILQAGNLRERHLEERSEHAAHLGSKSKVQAIKTIKRLEALQQMYKKNSSPHSTKQAKRIFPSDHQPSR